MLRRWLIGFVILSGVIFLIPLIYVQLSVPEVYRKPAEATVQGRTSNIVELAVIHNYRKEGRRVAVVQRPIIFIFEGVDDAPDRFMVVSRGYKTDFASLPRLSRYFFNPFDEYAEAAIVHDWLYAIAEPGKKREADMIFLRAMLDDGVSPITARYFYTAVRMGGLFGGGGYGRETEWTDAFYSVPLETDLVKDCIPEKPKTALYRMSDVASLEGVSPDATDRYNAMYAVMLQGYDPMTEAWLEALSSEACRVSLGSVIVENAYTDLAPILSQFTDDQERAHVEHMLVNSKASTIQTDLFSRDLYAQRFLDAYFQYRFGEPVPDKIRCIGVEQRLQLMLNVLWDKSDQASWPEIQCAVVEGQAPVLPSEAAENESADEGEVAEKDE